MTEHTLHQMEGSEKRYADETGTVWVRWRHSKRIDMVMILVGLLLGQVFSLGHDFGPMLGALGVLGVYGYLRYTRGGDSEAERADGDGSDPDTPPSRRE